ncbi:hypothetical protein GOP47_0028137 [Adiantum capillus-veneris]|nr:hypothetical protein GOP47_0028137 [Adiantum capillus-veneris]
MPTHYVTSPSSCCKPENSISPPPSPANGSSLSLAEPLTSSPSSSYYSCLQAETSCSFTHLLSSINNYPHPLQLDNPFSAISPLPFSYYCPHSQLKKRLALCELDEFSPLPKRLCESTEVHNCNDSVPSSCISNPISSIFHRNDEVIGGVDGGTEAPCTGGNATSGDLDDVLDFLLHGANPTPASTMLANVKDSGGVPMNGELAIAPGTQMRIQSSTLTYELEHCKYSGGNELIDWQKPFDEVPPLESNAGLQDKSYVEALEDRRGARIEINEAWGMLIKGQDEQVKERAKMGTFSEEWWNERARKNLSELSCGQQSISPAVSSASASTVKSGSSRSWAGPTLMDIESALALTCSSSSSTINYPPPPLVSAPFTGKSPFQLRPGAATAGSCLKEILHQETSSFLSASSSNSCKEESFTAVEEEEGEDRLCSWRSRLQKRMSHMEPRYTVKLRCEDDAVNDGYRWRKYGQKSIKNSPHPRSYYRCSSGACGVKKQVERSREDAGLLLVSYEGIHLHHRPNALPTPSLLHTCVPAAPTCQGSPLPPLPTISSTDDNNNTSYPLSASLSPLSHTSSTSTL